MVTGYQQNTRIDYLRSLDSGCGYILLYLLTYTDGYDRIEHLSLDVALRAHFLLTQKFLFSMKNRVRSLELGCELFKVWSGPEKKTMSRNRALENKKGKVAHEHIH